MYKNEWTKQTYAVAVLCTVKPKTQIHYIQIHEACVTHKTIPNLVNNDCETSTGTQNVCMCDDDDDKMNDVGIRIKVNACLYAHILI